MKFLFIFLSLFLSTLLFSQAPQGINYQAVMRNSSGNLITNSTVAIRVQIRQGSATGTTVYQERQSVASSSQGLINMVIGAGTPQVGTFNNINWAVGSFFVNLAVDFSNGVNYQDFGTQQLMSVPYALYAKTSGAQLNQWRYGNTIPTNSFGVLGDFYLDVVTGNVYYKNSATTWVLTGNIKGPVGPSGITGAQGAQGIQGLTGSQGIQGVAGAPGAAGTNGTNGQNTLVKSTTEVAGANCTTGGVKIEYGLDANSNGTLDVSEINATLTKYVCNGATGATGAQGIQGIQGVAGTNGTNGTNGVDGKNTLAKTTTEAAGANCTTGGVKIEYGLDANNNGTLDVSEINAALTKYVCNGAVGAIGAQGLPGIQGASGTNGAQGIQGVAGAAGTNGSNGSNGANGQNILVKTTTEAAGANCTTGGVKIEYGLDANNSGTLDISEINATLTRYVCNGAVGATGAQGAQGIQGVAGTIGATGSQGTIGLIGPTGANGAQGIQGVAGAAGTNGSNGSNGANGQNILVKTTTEAAGANCTSGGVKIEYGLDANSNGTLDVSEINATLTKYVCNGAVGTTGAQGIQGVAGAIGATGSQGTIGLTGPTGANGAQGIQGVAGAAGTNGSNGSNGANGQNTTVKTTTEAAGANCTTGGVKIEFGLDANSNGTLDVSEINATLTKYVCNGSNEPTEQIVSTSIPSNVVIFNTPTSFGTFLNWQVPLNVTRIQVECWGAGGTGGQNGVGGGGAYVKSLVNVVPGSIHQIEVGDSGNLFGCCFISIGGLSRFDSLAIAYGGNATPYAGMWNNLIAEGGTGIGQIVYNGQAGFLKWYNPGTTAMRLSAGGSSPFGAFGADSFGRYFNTPGGGGAENFVGGNGRVIITY